MWSPFSFMRNRVFGNIFLKNVQNAFGMPKIFLKMCNVCGMLFSWNISTFGNIILKTLLGLRIFL